jgi:hypothetical protein
MIIMKTVSYLALSFLAIFVIFVECDSDGNNGNTEFGLFPGKINYETNKSF